MVEQVVTDGHSSPIVSELMPLTVTLPEDGGLIDWTALSESWSLPRQIELGVIPELEKVPVPPDSVSASEMLVAGQSIPTVSPDTPVTTTLPLLVGPTSMGLIELSSLARQVVFVSRQGSEKVKVPPVRVPVVEHGTDCARARAGNPNAPSARPKSTPRTGRAIHIAPGLSRVT